MLPKKLSNLVGLKEHNFQSFINSKQIFSSNAQLISLLKTGDENRIVFYKEYRLYEGT